MLDMDDFRKLEYLQEKLNRQISETDAKGKAYNRAEAAYKTALQKKVLELRADNFPATLINLTVYGYVSDERLKRDIAKTEYESAKAAVNAVKLQIRVLDNQISREWYHSS